MLYCYIIMRPFSESSLPPQVMQSPKTRGFLKHSAGRSYGIKIA